ncbi:uncharacterized protein [Penaeus vannamei]|uniref:uncharacterized protein n=1 Tax=Penaeus vannamei TaxID=6689 RepID=UPI00387F62C8
MDWILDRATIQSHCGATLDVAILCESMEILVVALGAFSNEAKPLDLQVSWSKTKIQDFGGLARRTCSYLCRRTKLCLFKALVMPVFLYGSEPWTLYCALESCLDALCNRSSRQIMRYCWWDYVSNQRLHRETGTGYVMYTIRDRQLRLYGHFARFPQDVSVRDNPGWRKPVGRLRKSWLGQIDQTCCEGLKISRFPAMRDSRRWKQKLDAAIRPRRR